MNAYRPQVGDRVRLTNWTPGLYMDVLCAGTDRVFGRLSHDGYETTYPLAGYGGYGGGEWVKVAAGPSRPDADLLRRAATACRNLQHRRFLEGDDEWFDWVPKHLDQLADRLNATAEVQP